MPRARFVVLVLFCLSAVLPLHAAHAQSVEPAGNASGEKARWQRLVDDLETIKKCRGAGAARRAYADLTNAEQALIKKGLKVQRVRVSGNGRISNQRPPEPRRANREATSQGGEVTATQVTCFSNSATYTHENLWATDLYTITQTITWCQQDLSSGTFITSTQCSASGQGDNGFDLVEYFTYCGVAHGGVNWNAVKYITQAKFEDPDWIVIGGDPIYTPVLEQQIAVDGSYWRWHNGESF